MVPTIKCGKHFANHCKMTGSRFEDVCLGEAEFDNVSLVNAIFHNINMSDIKVSCIQWGGASFKDIGLPPIPECQGQKQRPLSFENCDINGSTFDKCDMQNVKIKECNLEGMTINGIPVKELIRVYEAGNR
jgi:uncharacterized protein YjbI with pentapeptide repeats